MLGDSTTPVPVVESERLVLHGHRRDDFAECAALWADPVVTRHVGGRPFAADEVWTKLLRYVGHWAVVGYGYWVVREKATGRFVGEVGFADFQRDIVPSFDGAPEAGWVLSPWSYGKGFATEAVPALVVGSARSGDRAGAYGMHDRPGQHGVGARRREVRLPRMDARDVQRHARHALRAPALSRMKTGAPWPKS